MLKRFSFPHCVALAPLSKVIRPCTRRFISRLFSVLLVYMSIFGPVPNSFDYPVLPVFKKAVVLFIFKGLAKIVYKTLLTVSSLVLYNILLFFFCIQSLFLGSAREFLLNHVWNSLGM